MKKAYLFFAAQAINVAAVGAALTGKAVPSSDVGADLLPGRTFDHGVLPLFPRKRSQKGGHLACIALVPESRSEHPTKLPAAFVIIVIDRIAEKFPLRIFHSIDERRIGKSRPLQKSLRLRAGVRRLQPAHHRFIRKQGIQLIQIALSHRPQADTGVFRQDHSSLCRLPRKVISGFFTLTTVSGSTEDVRNALPPTMTLSPISVAPPSSVEFA